MTPMLTVTAATAACCCVLVATAMAGTPRYQMTQLRSISTAVGTYATVNAINDQGLVVGGETSLVPTSLMGDVMDWSKTRPIAWNQSGSATLLPTVAGKGGLASAINDSGLVVGVSASAPSTSSLGRATIFRTTGATLIPPLASGSGYSTADGINANGIVFGIDSGTPFTFNTTTSAFTTLQRGSYQNVQAVAIDDAGVANANTFGASSRPLRLSATQTPTPLYPASNGGYSQDANNKGVAVGAYVGSYAPAPAVFANGTVTVLKIGAFENGWAMGLNDRNDVVGIAGTGWFSSASGTPFVRRDGTMIDLRTLLTGGTLPVGFKPLDINDRGQIIGEVIVDDDNNENTPPTTRSYRLDPIRTSGDANDDGAVNFNDLVTLAQNYNKTGNGNVFWETGDFNFDWKVDFADLVALAQNYNRPASIAADWAFAQSMVPEPAVLGTLSFGVLALRRRRSH